jgi:kynureninase
MNSSLAEAIALDAADPLTTVSAEFCHPRSADGRRHVYLCGHSLGLAPRSARGLVSEELDEWERLAVDGHHVARRPWIDYADRAIAGLASVTGARPHELVAMNSLSGSRPCQAICAATAWRSEENAPASIRMRRRAPRGR